MTISQTEHLNELFAKWQRKFPKKGFKKDGIIDEEKFNKQKTKYLFVTKEPNDPDKIGGDYRTEWTQGVSYNFAYRLYDWSYGLLYDFPLIDTIPDGQPEMIETLSCNSFMNLKKDGGGGSTNFSEIKQVVENEYSFIKKEIEIINPDVIIGSGLFDQTVWGTIFPDIQFKPSGYDIELARAGKYKIILYYHPSSRAPRSMSYSLLANVCQSSTFKKL